MRKFLQGFALAAIGLSLVFAQPAQAQMRLVGYNTDTLAANDDGSTGLVNIGFTINFFGMSYSQLYVNNNGNVTFDAPLGTFTPFPLLTTATPIIAPFFGDVDTRGGGGVVAFGNRNIGSSGPGASNPRNSFGVRWVNVGHFDATTLHNGYPLNTFQLVIIDRGDVSPGDFDFEFNYGTINWEAGEASGGLADGLCDASKADSACGPARAGWSNGVSSSYELAGSGVVGALLDAGTQPLINDQRTPAGYTGNNLVGTGPTVNTLQGRYLFAVRNGQVQPVVPEPMTIVLMGTGLIGVGLVQLRRNRQSEEV
jgi:hypothetical protein